MSKRHNEEEHRSDVHYVAMPADEEAADRHDSTRGGEEEEGLDYTVTVPKQPFYRILAIAATFGVVQFAWSIQIGWVAPTLKTLGVSNNLVAMAYLAGPISGIIGQITVGVVSDKCTLRMGRRRPFMLAGAFFTACAFLGFSNAQSLGEMSGDTAGSRPWGIFYGVLFFWLCDFAVNAIQGPVRFLLADVVPPEQQPLGNSLFGLCTGLGNTIGYFVGSIENVKDVLFVPWMGTDLRTLYTLAAILVMLAVITTCVLVPETQFKGNKVKKAMTMQSFGALFTSIQPALYAVYLVQFCTWFAMFTYFIYGTSWVGVNVYGGSSDENAPNHPQFEEGVRAGNLAMGFSSIVSFFFTVFLPTFMKWFGVKPCYMFSQAVMGVFLISTVWWYTHVAGYVVLAMMGVAYGTTQVIPWMLVTMSISKQGNKGFYLSFMNLFQCLPEIMVSLMSYGWLYIWNDNIAAILCLGGVVSLVGGVIVLFIGVDAIYAEADVVPPRTLCMRVGTAMGGSEDPPKGPYNTFNVDSNDEGSSLTKGASL